MFGPVVATNLCHMPITPSFADLNNFQQPLKKETRRQLALFTRSPRFQGLRESNGAP
jgi:hypothetical protein